MGVRRSYAARRMVAERVDAASDSRLSKKLLVNAAEGLARINGAGATYSWEIVAKLDRRKSTVFRLQTSHADGSRAFAYYKIPRPGSFSTADQGQRGDIHRLVPMTDRFIQVTRGSTVTAAPVLAIEESTRSVVTLEIPGVSLASLIIGFRPFRVRRLAGPMFSLGKACRAIEHTSRAWHQVPESTVRTLVAGSLRDYGAVLELIPQGLTHLEGLVEEVEALPQATEFCHSDLFGTNVLLSRRQVGLIDFSWSPRLRMHDVAHIAFRAAAHTRLPVSSRRYLIGRLIDGYGAIGLAEDPSWRLVRALTVLKHLSRSPSRPRAMLAGTTVHLEALLRERDPWF